MSGVSSIQEVRIIVISNVGSDWVTLSVRIIRSPLPPLRVIIEPIKLTSRPHTSTPPITQIMIRDTTSRRCPPDLSPVSLYSGGEVIVRGPPSLHPRRPLTRFELQMTPRRRKGTRRHWTRRHQTYKISSLGRYFISKYSTASLIPSPIIYAGQTDQFVIWCWDIFTKYLHSAPQHHELK